MRPIAFPPLTTPSASTTILRDPSSGRLWPWSSSALQTSPAKYFSQGFLLEALAQGCAEGVKNAVDGIMGAIQDRILWEGATVP